MKALLISLVLLAQAPGDTLPDLSRPWTLEQCTAWALEHNLTVAQQEINRERSAVDKNTGVSAAESAGTTPTSGATPPPPTST